ncbi:MAG: CoA-binding protein [Candidatus Rokuibacteriota bacterium]
MNTDLTPLFAPRRVAVLGASRSPKKLGHRLLQNLLDAAFPGEVLPVNPSGELCRATADRRAHRRRRPPRESSRDRGA